MRVLFAALHPGYYRNIESVVDELARRGHEIHLGFERPDSGAAGEIIIRRMAGRHRHVTFGSIPGLEPETAFLASKIRLARDYLRYLSPIYPSSSILRSRARSRTPTGMVALTRTRLLQPRPARFLMVRALDAIDRALPASPAIQQFLDEWRPDFVVITPLIGLVASSQLDLLRAAQARALPTAVLVWSWDHLSSKALIRDLPDALFVWNDAQKREALDWHGVPAERIVTTGAPCFDQWFDRTPSRTRQEFVRHVGLAEDRPYVLWTCSALLPGGPPEPQLALRWARHLRASSHPRLREAGILIRPHPSRVSDWANADWRVLGNVALFGGDNPIDHSSRADYFDSLYHSAAVVGINTSAFIEAAIIHRPVMTIFFHEVQHEHEGSLHFQLLWKFAGGLVTVARTLEEHEGQLAAMIDGPPPDVMAQQQFFVRSFVRPHGLDVRATDSMADALERIGTAGGKAVACTPSPIGRFGLGALKIIERHQRWRYLLLDEREVANAARVEAKDRLRHEALARKHAQRMEKARRAAERRVHASRSR